MFRGGILGALGLLVAAVACTHRPVLPRAEHRAGSASEGGTVKLESPDGGERSASHDSTYPVDYASPRRDSAMTAVAATRGELSWSVPLERPPEPDLPSTVLTWGRRLVVASWTQLALFDPDGTLLWKRPKQPGTPVAVAMGRLYFKAPNTFLSAVDSTNRAVLADAPFPGGNAEQVRVELFWPREEDFVAVLVEPGEYEVPDGDPPEAPRPFPETDLLRNRYGKTYGDWDAQFRGTPWLPPLFLPDRSLAVLALGRDRVLRLDVGQGDADGRELSRFSLPLSQVSHWSAGLLERGAASAANDGSDEVYWLLGTEGAPGTAHGAESGASKKVVVAVTGTGQELWRWTEPADSKTGEAWASGQPPIAGNKGRVFALTQRRVLALDSGRLAWSHPLRAPVASPRATALADGSLLVAAGNRLLHLDAQGRTRFEVEVAAQGDEVRSAPVVGADGAVYVATRSRLVRIQ